MGTNLWWARNRSFGEVAKCHPALHPVGRAGDLPDASAWSWFDPRLFLSRSQGRKFRLAQPKVANSGHLEHTKRRVPLPTLSRAWSARRQATLSGIQKGEKCLPRVSRGCHSPARPAERLENRRLSARIGGQRNDLRKPTVRIECRSSYRVFPRPYQVHGAVKVAASRCASPPPALGGHGRCSASASRLLHDGLGGAAAGVEAAVAMIGAPATRAGHSWKRCRLARASRAL
jgi:hypothetical protein